MNRIVVVAEPDLKHRVTIQDEEVTEYVDAQDLIGMLRQYCLAKPGAFEDHPWGDAVFKAGSKGKIFCGLGTQNPRITVKSTVEKQAALILHPNIDIAAYVGRYGWVTLDVDDEQTFELALQLIDESYSYVSMPQRSQKQKRKT